MPLSAIYNKYTYRSFSHALQSEKFRRTGHNDTAFKFTLESKDKIGQSTGLDSNRNRKIIILTKEELAKWEECRSQIKKDIYIAKFSAGSAKKVLLLTYDAQLWSCVPRGKILRCFNLELTRQKLNEIK